MARIRSIHPGQATDEDFVEMSRDARLFTLHLRCEADDQGVFEWKPRRLKMAIFPADDDVNVEAILSELVANRQVRQFEFDGKRYGVIRNFRRWQRPKRPNSIHPLPAEFRTYAGFNVPSDGTGNEPDDDEGGGSGEQVPNKFPTGGEIPPQMEDGGGRREEGKEDADASSKRARAGVAQEFAETFWPAYPHKVGKADAEKKFQAARKLADLSAIMAGLERYVASKPKDRQWCNPATWLHQQRWTDAPAEPVAAAPVRKTRQQLEDEANDAIWDGVDWEGKKPRPVALKPTHDHRGVPLTDRGYPIDNDPWAGVQ